jgi:hypothetical protein
MFILQSLNAKFIKHLSYDLQQINETIVYTPHTLYDMAYRFHDQIKNIVFLSSQINAEVVDFIFNTDLKSKIVLYFDSFNALLLDDAVKNNLKVLVHSNEDVSKHKKYPRLIKLNHYYSQYLVNHIQDHVKYDNMDIICDLNGLDSMPDDLSTILHPNTDLNIKLFNNPNISHCQNLGMVDEVRFVSLIKSSNLYIDLNGLYLAYALYYGIPTLTTQINNFTKKQVISIDNIISTKNNSNKIDLNIIEKCSYKHLIENYIL